jgi:hypothetical protein
VEVCSYMCRSSQQRERMQLISECAERDAPKDILLFVTHTHTPPSASRDGIIAKNPLRPRQYKHYVRLFAAIGSMILQCLVDVETGASLH